MSKTVSLVGTVLEELRATFCNEERPPLGGVTAPPEHRPGGDVALDGLWNEGCQGLAFVNVLQMYRTPEFPNEVPTASPCRHPLTVVLQVGVARCVATVDDHGAAPPADDMERDALIGIDDAERLERAMCRALKRADERGIMVQGQAAGVQPTGPAGGALAWTMNATIQLS